MLTLIGAGWKVLPKRLLAASARLPRIIDQVIAREAHRFRNEVVKTFRNQGSAGKSWPSLHPLTVALRRAGVGGGRSGGTKALARSGSLRSSVNVHRRGYAKYFVGAHRKGKRGVDVARIHDHGPVIIPITKRMRQYFMYLFYKGVIPFPWPPRRKRFLVIPRRSFMTDTFEVFKRGSKARVLTDFTAQMARI
jgi:hypothetical protein